jgi:hypothetical protein
MLVFLICATDLPQRSILGQSILDFCTYFALVASQKGAKRVKTDRKEFSQNA